MNAPVRVIGIGSPHGADRVGWEAVEQLRRTRLEEHFPAGSVSLEICEVPAALHGLVEGCRCALLLDAAGIEAGQLVRLEADDIADNAGGCSVHGVGVGDMLALIRVLEDPAPKMVVFGIGVGTDREAGAATAKVPVSRLGRLLEQEIRAQLTDR